MNNISREINHRIDHNCSEIVKLKQRLETSEVKINTVLNFDEEITDRFERMSNIMVHGVTEDNNEGATLRDKSKSDHGKILNLINNTRRNWSQSLSKTFCSYRINTLSNSQTKPHMIKICSSYQSCRNEFKLNFIR